jgi:hypothetical protein
LLRHVGNVQLNDNGFTGTIPTEVGFMTNVDGLVDLSCNKLSGTLPTELGNLINMYGLYLFGNTALSGTIPSELGQLTHLVEFLAYGSQLNGSVPLELCKNYNASNLTKLELDCTILCSCCNDFCY